jgi:hypothetical protein
MIYSNPKKYKEYLKKQKRNDFNKSNGLLKCNHHLDLNQLNNKNSNLFKLTFKNHNRFHRLAYHYLLKKFGIKEILRYKNWFLKNNSKIKYGVYNGRPIR